jgi:hypothetical protein
MPRTGHVKNHFQRVESALVTHRLRQNILLTSSTSFADNLHYTSCHIADTSDTILLNSNIRRNHYHRYEQYVGTISTAVHHYK